MNALICGGLALAAGYSMALRSRVWLADKMEKPYWPWRDQAIGLVSAVCGIAVGSLYHHLLQAVALSLLASVLVLVAWTDLECRIVPNRALGVALLALLLVALTAPLSQLENMLQGGALLFLLTGGTRLLGLGGMGGGDVKMAAVLGMFFGPHFGSLILIIGLVVALVHVSVMALLRRQSVLRQTFAMAPYLSLAGLLLTAARPLGVPV